MAGFWDFRQCMGMQGMRLLRNLRYAIRIELSVIIQRFLHLSNHECSSANEGTKKARIQTNAGFGSPNWTRTSDTLINSQVLYRLSYGGINRREVRKTLTSVVVLANTYFPGPSPAKYLRHDRA